MVPFFSGVDEEFADFLGRRFGEEEMGLFLLMEDFLVMIEAVGVPGGLPGG